MSAEKASRSGESAGSLQPQSITEHVQFLREAIDELRSSIQWGLQKRQGPQPGKPDDRLEDTNRTACAVHYGVADERVTVRVMGADQERGV